VPFAPVQIGEQVGHTGVAGTVLGCAGLGHDCGKIGIRIAASDPVQQSPQREHIVRDRGQGPGQPRRAGERARHRARKQQRVAIIGQQPGNAEIEQPHPALAVDQNVRRLEVAVRHKLAMRIMHRARGFGKAAQAFC